MSKHICSGKDCAWVNGNTPQTQECQTCGNTRSTQELTDTVLATRIKDLVKELNDAANEAANAGLQCEFDVRSVSELSIGGRGYSVSELSIGGRGYSVNVWMMCAQIARPL